jgi:hypothetical protein
MAAFSTGEAVASNGGGQPLSSQEARAVSGVTETVKQKGKWGGARPGSGPKPRQPGVAGIIPREKVQDQAPPSEADIEFVKTIAEAGLRVLDRVESNIICSIIDQIDDKFLNEKRDAYLRQREIGPGDIEIVVNAAGALAAKYSILTRYAPEAALVSWSTIHGMSFQAVVSELRKLARVIKEAKLKTKASADANSP